MSQHNRYVPFLTALLPAGVFGLSLALASNAAKATPTQPESPRLDPEANANTLNVASELQAIRDAVDEASTEINGGRVAHVVNPDVRLAFWLNGNGLGWGNGGAVWGNGGYPPWGNARPWGNGWGNGGWGNGGGWHNWRNGNGWRN